jgi:hypothetical protein
MRKSHGFKKISLEDAVRSQFPVDIAIAPPGGYSIKNKEKVGYVEL